MEKANLEHMWVDELMKEPEAFPNERAQYVYLTRRKIDGVCGWPWISEFIGNTHSSKKIRATVKTTSWYLGRKVGESSKEVVVKPGKANEVELGCTGWANPTGADTEYRREITYAEWA
mgnify:CR=1 FL=1